MTQTQKYWLTLGFLFMAFSYTADGYQAAAYLFSCFALYTAAEAHGYQSIRREGKKILFYGGLATILTLSLDITKDMPAVWFVSFSSTACSLLFEESSFKALKSTVFWMRIVMFILYLLTLALPQSVYGMYHSLYLITAAYLPIQLTYFHKVFVFDSKKYKLRMATRPQVY